ncbi:MAG: ABC transporter ATP-binding protein [Dehalococcoidia bacterium]|nr:ABC transporter ATP-binding protein [Dehalococcoidia bacterium]
MQDGILLDVKDVSKIFGGLMAVHRVSFQVPRGKIIAIIGPNGAGKTTLFNVIAGLFTPSSGEIWFKGHKISGMASHQIASAGIARTFQLIQLFTNMTVHENVMVGRHPRTRAGFLSTALRLPTAIAEEKQIRGKALEMLALVGLESRANDSPLSLPYGQQKILEIARALATEPELILLDEPAGGLSVHEIEGLARQILNIRDSGVTVLLVEHRMELVMGIADWVIVLNYGEKMAEGPPSQIQNDERVIAAYLGDEHD